MGNHPRVRSNIRQKGPDTRKGDVLKNDWETYAALMVIPVVLLLGAISNNEESVRTASYDSLRPAVAFHVTPETPEAPTPCVAAYVAAYRPGCLAAIAQERQEVEALWLQQQQSSAIVSDSSPVYSGSGNDYEAYIWQHYPQYAETMIRIMWCESTGQADPPHNNVCRGLFQFNPGTWAGTPEGAAGADILDPFAQIRMTAWMIDQGRQGEWACH